MSKLTHMTEFLDSLTKEAEMRRIDAGYQGRHDDGGAKMLLNMVCAYRSGQEGKIPAFWVDKYNKFLDTLDPEYEEYLRLQKKFGK